jgi:hypothetical protein
MVWHRRKASEPKTMDTVQLLFRTRAANKDEDLLDKVQSYLAALLHNGQIVGDRTPMAKVSGGLLVTVSLPEADALVDRFANKWVRKSLRELEAAGVDHNQPVHRIGSEPHRRAGVKGEPHDGRLRGRRRSRTGSPRASWEAGGWPRASRVSARLSTRLVSRASRTNPLKRFRLE